MRPMLERYPWVTRLTHVPGDRRGQLREVSLGRRLEREMRGTGARHGGVLVRTTGSVRRVRAATIRQ